MIAYCFLSILAFFLQGLQCIVTKNKVADTLVGQPVTFSCDKVSCNAEHSLGRD